MLSDKKINILFIIDEILGFGGGTENHLATVLEHIDKEKFNAVVVTFETNGGPVVDRIIRSGAIFKYIPVGRFYGLKAVLQALKLIKLIKAYNINIVQTFLFKADIYGATVAKIAGVPHIISSRRDMGDLRKRRHLLAYKFVNRFFEQFIAVCDSVKNMMVNIEGIPETKIKTIYNGVDLKKFNFIVNTYKRTRKDLNIDEETFLIGNISHFRPEKDHQTFFDAIKIVKSHGKKFKVLLLGDGPTEEFYKEYCHKIGIGEDVIFYGSVANIVPFITIMDVICLVPNKNEGLSNAVVEGMAMKKPVIGTIVGGNPELIIDGETGFLIPPNDPKSLAKCIIKLYDNTDLRIKMGIMGRDRVKKNFELTKMIKQMEHLYAGIFSNHRAIQ